MKKRSLTKGLDEANGKLNDAGIELEGILKFHESTLRTHGLISRVKGWRQVLIEIEEEMMDMANTIQYGPDHPF